MSRIEAVVQGDLSSGVSVGDEIEFTGVARITGIEEDVVDVTSFGGKPVMAGGERSYKLLITADFA